MKALQPLNFLIRHLQPSSPRSSLPPPFPFYFARATRLSVTPSNRVFRPRQAQFHSTATSSKEAFQNNASTQNAKSTSTSTVSSPFYAVKPGDGFSSGSPKDSHDTSFDPALKDLRRCYYNLTFTCKPCDHRSTHDISKQGYHDGTVLITCPNCKNRHVISDHLKVRSLSSLLFQKVPKADPAMFVHAFIIDFL